MNQSSKLSSFIPAVSLCLGALSLITISSRAFANPAGTQKTNAFNTKPAGKLAPWEAMQLAAKASGGKAVSANFEFDEGKWIYGVVVVKGHKLYEVELDPTSGKVGETEAVTPEGEGKEIKSELTRALKDAGN